MLSTLFWIAVGAFIGWNFPQPGYAIRLQEWAVAKWNSITTKSED